MKTLLHFYTPESFRCSIGDRDAFRAGNLPKERRIQTSVLLELQNRRHRIQDGGSELPLPAGLPGGRNRVECLTRVFAAG